MFNVYLNLPSNLCIDTEESSGIEKQSCLESFICSTAVILGKSCSVLIETKFPVVMESFYMNLCVKLCLTQDWTLCKVSL